MYFLFFHDVKVEWHRFSACVLTFWSSWSVPVITVSLLGFVARDFQRLTWNFFLLAVKFSICSFPLWCMVSFKTSKSPVELIIFTSFSCPHLFVAVGNFCLNRCWVGVSVRCTGSARRRGSDSVCLFCLCLGPCGKGLWLFLEKDRLSFSFRTTSLDLCASLSMTRLLSSFVSF